MRCLAHFTIIAAARNENPADWRLPVQRDGNEIQNTFFQQLGLNDIEGLPARALLEPFPAFFPILPQRVVKEKTIAGRR